MTQAGDIAVYQQGAVLSMFGQERQDGVVADGLGHKGLSGIAGVSLAASGLIGACDGGITAGGKDPLKGFPEIINEDNSALVILCSLSP